jgi:predicted flap endonuclease-1-like 5' DNA nuclease
LRGKAIWILGFFTFLSALNAITAIVLSINIGIQTNFQPYLIGGLTGAIPVYVYLVASILATLFFLAATSHKIVKDLTDTELLNEINQRAGLLQDGQTLLESNQKEQKRTIFIIKQNLDQTKKQISNSFVEQEKVQNKIREELVNTIKDESVNITIKNRKNLKDKFIKQEETLAELHSSLTTRLEGELANIKAQIGTQLQKLQNTLQESEKIVKKNTKTITNQKSDIAEIKEKIIKLEEEFVKPKAQLTSQSNPEEIRGIGPNINNELKEMGINSVDELILADPRLIAKKTSISEKMALKLQGIAQLSLIPSLQEKDIILLEEIGITNQQELANQKPIDIGRNINKVLKGLINSGKIVEEEKPTIEEIRSWIKFAKI